MDFSSKETAIPRVEDKISNAIFPDGQKLLLASNTPDAPAQNQVSGSHSELASSSGGVTKHAPVEMVGWPGTINRNDSSTFTFESDELCAPGQWTTLDERIVDDRKVWIIVVDNFLIWMFGNLQIKGKVTCYRRLSTPCHRSGLWIDRIRDFWLIGVGVLNSRKQTRQLVHGSMSWRSLFCPFFCLTFSCNSFDSYFLVLLIFFPCSTLCIMRVVSGGFYILFSYDWKINSHIYISISVYR